MSVLVAPTRGFDIGVARTPSRRGLAGINPAGVIRTPAQQPPRLADSETHPIYRGLHGLSLGAVSASDFDRVSPPIIVRTTPYIPTNSTTSSTAAGSSGSATASTTPVSNPITIYPAGQMARLPSTGTPVPAFWPETKPYVDGAGNTWEYIDGSWQITSTATSTQTSPTPTTSAVSSSGATSITPPSSGLPTNPVVGSYYLDSAGNTWQYTSSGWTETALAASGSSTVSTVAAPSAGLPSNPVVGNYYTDSAGNQWQYTASGWVETATEGSASSSISNWMSSLTTFLDESTIISGVQNFWIIAGVGAAALLLMRGKH